MKLSKSLTTSLAAAAVTASAAVSSVNAAEIGGVDVSASAGVANMYLYRGFDVGNGDAAVFGDITASAGGFYGGVWASSGDAFAGQEYDLFVGYGAEFGDFYFDLAAVSYIYPNSPDPGMDDTDFGDWIEAILTVGYGPVSFAYYETVEAEENTYAFSEDYNYITLGFEMGSFGATLGRHDYAEGDDTHLDLSYAYNDRLSFTVSKMIDASDETEAADLDDALFVVSYTLPLE